MHKDSPVIKESIEYFSSIILSAPLDNTLTAEEIDIFYNPLNLLYSFRLINKYNNIVEGNEEEFLKNIGKHFSLSDWEDEISSKGRYLNYKDSQQCIFYGFSLGGLNPINDNYNKFAFSVCFLLEELKHNKNINKKYIYHECEDGWLYVKTDISNIINDNTGKKYFEQLKNIINDVFLPNLK